MENREKGQWRKCPAEIEGCGKNRERAERAGMQHCLTQGRDEGEGSGGGGSEAIKLGGDFRGNF